MQAAAVALPLPSPPVHAVVDAEARKCSALDSAASAKAAASPRAAHCTVQDVVTVGNSARKAIGSERANQRTQQHSQSRLAVLTAPAAAAAHIRSRARSATVRPLLLHKEQPQAIASLHSPSVV